MQRVLVLGSGVIGVTSAWYLAQAGFEVTVVDREPGPARSTSYANAGQISPGYASPWAAPGVPLKAIKWLFQKHAPLAIKPTLDPDQYLWLAQMLRNCTAGRYAVNKERMVRLAEYSRDCLDELRADTGLTYEGRRLGTTQLFRTQAQLDAAARDIAVLQEAGVPYEVLDRAGVARVEPALAATAEERAQRIGIGRRVDQAAELEPRVGQQARDNGHVGAVDQLVGHQHPAHAVAVRIAHLRRGRQGDAPGAGLQLHREQLRAHGGLAVRGQLDPVGGHEPPHPVQVVGHGRIAQHRHRQADLAGEDAPAGRAHAGGVEHRIGRAQPLAGQLPGCRMKQIIVWHPDVAPGPRYSGGNLCTT